jgi:hypothetical protein
MHRSEFLVPSMGRKFIDVGSSPERASAFKLSESFVLPRPSLELTLSHPDGNFLILGEYRMFMRVEGRELM